MAEFTQEIQQALVTDQVIDITTTGRRSGQPRRIEIWFHNLDGRLYITGTPGRHFLLLFFPPARNTVEAWRF